MQWNEIISLAEQDARKIGREEGREEGRAEAIFESVSKIVDGGMCDADRACELLGVSPEEYRAYTKNNQ